LKGITPIWLDLTGGEGGVAALELRGKYTSLIAHHLQLPDDCPRGSTLRNDKRLWNQQNPILVGFPGAEEAEQPESSLINLLLVHGGRSAEFAFLRVYHSFDNARDFIPFSGNIMLLEPETAASPGEAEQIAEAEIQLKEHLKKIRKNQAEE